MDRAPRARVRRLWIGGLGAISAMATASVWLQIHALSGSRGIIPADRVLERVAEQAGGRSEGFWVAPTLLWWLPLDAGLHAVAALGFAASLMVAAGVLEGPALLLAWVAWTSLSTAGTVFLSFQWDTLLSEALFLGLFVARWRSDGPEPHPGAWWLIQFLAFRLMFFAGVVKLASGDPTWRDGTALAFHFETQPLPNPLSWWAHQLPLAAHQLAVAATFVIELVLPWFIFAGATGRAIAFAGAAALLALLAATGNYGFFQLLSVLVCVSWLDDAHLGGRPTAPPVRLGWRDAGWILVSPLIVVIAAGQTAGRVGLADAVPDPVWALTEAAAPFRVGNGYGLFAVMTTERPEIEFEGTSDGNTWTPVRTPYRPSDILTRPPQVAPHHPRLDWQLWFAALSRCEAQPWVGTFMERLVAGTPAVRGLLHPDDRERPLIAVRANLWSYRFTRINGTSAPAGYWTRTWIGPYCPVVQREP